MLADASDVMSEAVGMIEEFVRFVCLRRNCIIFA